MIVSEKKISLCASEEVAKTLRTLHHLEDEASREREHFWSIGLNVKNVTKYIELVSLGSLTASLVHPREVMRMAVIKGCASLIFVHNHPSGEAKPSQEDIILTRRLSQAGHLLGIRVLDHIIITDETHFSFRDSGMMITE